MSRVAPCGTVWPCSGGRTCAPHDGRGREATRRTARAGHAHDLVASTLEYTLLVDVLAVHLTGRALVISPLTSAMLEVRRAVEFKPFSFSSVRGGRFRR